MEWYERIKERRINLGLTQQELADMMGYKSKSTINKIELGKNDIPQSKISRFCEVLELTESQLMGYDNTEEFILTEDEKDIIRLYRTLHPEAKKFIFKAMTAQQEPIKQDEKANEKAQKAGNSTLDELEEIFTNKSFSAL